MMKEVAKSAEDHLVRQAEAQSLGNLLDRWLEHGRMRRERSTIDGYRRRSATGSGRSLGHYRLDEITTRTLDDWYNQLTDEGVSAASVMAYHRIISAALRQAEKWGDVTVESGSPGLTAAGAEEGDGHAVARPGEGTIEAAEESQGTLDLAELILLAVLTGMRRGELCGLQWGDIDWTQSVIVVRHAIWQTSALPSEGRPAEWGMKNPKTHQNRTLQCGPAALALLRRRLERLGTTAALAEVEVKWEDTFVFAPDPISHPAVPLLPSWVSRRSVGCAGRWRRTP